ncbi:unnamed protein product [Caenorhabditis nigoni]
MRNYLFLLVLLAVSTAGDLLPTYSEADEEIAKANQSKVKNQEFVSVMNHRSYAYTSAFLILVLFAAVIWCHVASARKSRRLAQFEQRGAPVPPVEWSPLLQERKNLRPPPPYSQVV